MSSRFFNMMIQASAMRTNALHSEVVTVSFNNAPLISPKPVKSSWVTDVEGTNCHANKLATIVEGEDFKDPTPLPDIAKWDGTHPFEPEQFIQRHEILAYVEQFGKKAEDMLFQMLSDDCHPPSAMFVYKGDSEDFLRFIPCENSGLCDWCRSDAAVFRQPSLSEPEDRLGQWLDSVFSGYGPDPVPSEEFVYDPTEKMACIPDRGKLDNKKEGTASVYGPLLVVGDQSSGSSSMKKFQSDIALHMAAGLKAIDDTESVTSETDQVGIEHAELDGMMPFFSQPSSNRFFWSEDFSGLNLEDILVWSRSEEEDRLEQGRLAVEKIDCMQVEQGPQSQDIEESPPALLSASFSAHTPEISA